MSVSPGRQLARSASIGSPRPEERASCGTFPVRAERAASGQEATRTFGFFLLQDFPLLSVAAAVDPLRAANVLAGRPLFEWRYVSMNGDEVCSSSGVLVRPHARVGDDLKLDMLFVCAGGNACHFDDEPTFAWLRRLDRRGVAIGAISGGPYVLAKAGLLRGRRCTVHWEHTPAFREAFPDIDLRRTLFEADHPRYTCAGGTAALDMMNELIAHDLGLDLAQAASEWLLQTHIRLGESNQRMTARERFDVAHPRLAAALERIDATFDKNRTRRQLADELGITVRHLERLFATHLHTTIQRHVVGLRLERARTMLRQTTLPITEVALACGFANSSHFSRLYRKRFGAAPSDRRGRDRSH